MKKTVQLKFRTQAVHFNYLDYAEIPNYYHREERKDNGTMDEIYTKDAEIIFRDNDPNVDTEDSTIPQSTFAFKDYGTYKFEYEVGITRDDNDGVIVAGDVYLAHRWWADNRWHYQDFPMSVTRRTLKQNDKTYFNGSAVVSVDKYDDTTKHSYILIANVNVAGGNPRIKTDAYDTKPNFPATSGAKMLIKKIK